MAGETRLELSTPEGQTAFDRGLRLHYGFYAEQALAAFEQAAALEPGHPLPRWGIALALGPRTNDPDMSMRMERAYKEAQAAIALTGARDTLAADLARAVATRYVNAKSFDADALNRNYVAAMEAVAARYQRQDDVATLYAEALALATSPPWWGRDGTPNAELTKGIPVLEGVLQRQPTHVGANHYYVHFIEGTADPQRGLPSAKRLETLVPDVGHLLHMPSHIYMRVGDYAAAVAVNQRAMAADAAGGGAHTHEGVAGMLAGHTKEYLASAAAMTGQSAIALAADPYFFPRLRYGRWDELIAYEPVDGGTFELEWRIARTIAFTAQRRLREARAERRAVSEHARSLPADAEWWGDPLPLFLAMAESELDARLAWVEGRRTDAIAHWRTGVAAQDKLTRSEAVLSWFHPLRESLGAALYSVGDHAAADQVFRDDLKLNPNNPRSLFGLWQSQLARGMSTEARATEERFRAQWRNADVELTIADLH